MSSNRAAACCTEKRLKPEGAPYSSTIAANMSSARAATALWRRRSITARSAGVVRAIAGKARLAAAGNREVHIIAVAEANLADLFLGRGIEQRRSVVAMRHDESAVDVDRADGAHGIAPFRPSEETCAVHDDLISSSNGDRLMSIVTQ